MDRGTSICNSVTLLLGTDFADDTDIFLVVVLKIQAPEFSARTILRRSVNFAFYLDPFAEVDELAYFNVY